MAFSLLENRAPKVQPKLQGRDCAQLPSTCPHLHGRRDCKNSAQQRGVTGLCSKKKLTLRSKPAVTNRLRPAS